MNPTKKRRRRVEETPSNINTHRESKKKTSKFNIVLLIMLLVTLILIAINDLFTLDIKLMIGGVIVVISLLLILVSRIFIRRGSKKQTRVFQIINFIFLTTALVISGSLYNDYLILKKTTNSQNVAKTTESKETVSVLFLGADNQLTSDGAGQNYDAIIVYSINPSTSQITTTSVPRDTLVTSECAGYEKINHNGWSGFGPDCMVTAVESLLQIPINYYAVIDFAGIIKVVDTLGGIELCNDLGFDIVSQDSNRTQGTVTIPQGCNMLNGEQALAFARQRKDTNAIVRSNNHSIVIQAIIKQALANGVITNYKEYIQLISDITVNNIPTQQYSVFAKVAAELFLNPNKTIDQKSLSFEGSGTEYYSALLGMNVYGYIPNIDSLNALRTELKERTKNPANPAFTPPKSDY
ncbi:MAG: LCP family protein [Mycoplasmatales bacterium]